MHDRNNHGEFAVFLPFDGDHNPHHVARIPMLERRHPVAMDGQVRRLADASSAQALHDLALIDAALLHTLLRMPRQDDAIAFLGDDAQFLEKPGIAKAQWLDRSHTHIVYGFRPRCQCRAEGKSRSRELLPKLRNNSWFQCTIGPEANSHKAFRQSASQ